MNSPNNASESWSLYDTVCIGKNQKTYHPKWYDSFFSLGSDTNIPFFNQRNRSSVGVPYCSFDSAEQISFGFECYSIGLEWYAPIMGESFNDEEDGWRIANNNNPQLFFELLRHTSVRLQIGQDEKLSINGLGVPGGGGFGGYALATNVSFPEIQTSTYQSISNGTARLKNRYKFIDPITQEAGAIRIPRNRNLAAWVEFSPYAKELLKKMEGPHDIAFSFSNNKSIPACYMMRISMFGKREVQQRNQLHF